MDMTSDREKVTDRLDAVAPWFGSMVSRFLPPAARGCCLALSGSTLDLVMPAVRSSSTRSTTTTGCI